MSHNFKLKLHVLLSNKILLTFTVCNSWYSKDFWLGSGQIRFKVHLFCANSFPSETKSSQALKPVISSEALFWQLIYLISHVSIKMRCLSSFNYIFYCCILRSTLWDKPELSLNSRWCWLPILRYRFQRMCWYFK